MSRTISEVCGAIVDCEHKSAPIDPTGAYFAVGTPAMKGNRINYDEARRIDAKTFGNWTRRLTPRRGDLLFAREAPVGPVVRIPATENVAPGQRTMLLRPDPDCIDSDYMYYLMSSPLLQAQFEALSEGSTVPHLNVADVKNLALPALPTVAEQRAIADVLGALDDKIAANTKLATTAESLLSAEFERQRLDVLPGTPGDGVEVSDLFELNPKRPRPSADEPVYVDMARLPTGGFSVRGWTHREAKGGVRFMNGDTVMARITPCLENGKVGYIDFLSDGEIGVGSTEYIVIRSRTDQGVPPELSYFLARSPRFQGHAVQQMVGSSGRQRLAAVDIADYQLSVVEPDLLHAFGETARPVFEDVRSRVAENRTLAATRDALLPALMSGKLRVEEAAEVAGL